MDYNGSYDQIENKLENMGFSQFYVNFNPEHYGGNDFQAFVNGNWYHATVGRPMKQGLVTGAGGAMATESFDPESRPPFIQFHCDMNRPNSIKHGVFDYALPKIRQYRSFIPRISILP